MNKEIEKLTDVFLNSIKNCYSTEVVVYWPDDTEVNRIKKITNKITDIREEISILVANTAEHISTEKEQKVMMWLNKALEALKIK